MQIPSDTEIAAQGDAHVHTAERVGLDGHPPHPQCVAHIPAGAGITLAHHDPGGIGCRIGVAEKDDVEPLAAQQPGRPPREAGAARGVEHLDGDAAAGRGQRVRMPLDPLGLGRCQVDRARHQGGEQDDQAGGEEPAARLFQKRTVGSGMGQPDVTRRDSRNTATSRSTPIGS
jgi:hypothetical protein